MFPPWPTSFRPCASRNCALLHHFSGYFPVAERYFGKRLAPLGRILTDSTSPLSRTCVTQRPRSTDKSSSLGRPNSLIALGSAAVMTVYAAGFARTEAAAQRLEEGSDARRRPAPASVSSGADQASPQAQAIEPALPAPNATQTSDHAKSTATPTTQPLSATPASKTTTSIGDVRTASPSAPATVAAAAAPVISAPTTTSAASTPTTAPISASIAAAIAPPVSAPVSAPAGVAVSAPVALPAATTSSATTAVPPTAAAPSTKSATLTDGTYTGWGSSRHGDIEATVVIEGGKITGAIISRCLTQYSCSWVAHLQAQVVTRQSPEVDNVSGATQSANAFYYAVIDALKKAK